MSDEVTPTDSDQEAPTAVSVTGRPMVKGDRVLYLCQCLRPKCPTGERATVLDRDEVVAHFPDEAQAPSTYVYVKFDSNMIPDAAEAAQFVHLEDLDVPEILRGTVEEHDTIVAAAEEAFAQKLRELTPTTPEVI